ncbi:hypothetical protein H4582DRAFT_170515 [Lactarius indigo]|nr:hypothetical protein H4582DRAFT_170515 [Lactarius indigo]
MLGNALRGRSKLAWRWRSFLSTCLSFARLCIHRTHTRWRRQGVGRREANLNIRGVPSEVLGGRLRRHSNRRRGLRGIGPRNLSRTVARCRFPRGYSRCSKMTDVCNKQNSFPSFRLDGSSKISVALFFLALLPSAVSNYMVTCMLCSQARKPGVRALRDPRPWRRWEGNFFARPSSRLWGGKRTELHMHTHGGHRLCERRGGSRGASFDARLS